MYEKTFSIKTLGCKCNQYESAQIASQFLSNGFKAVPFGSPADIVIINTCTVTDKSNKKCRNYIRQGAKFSKSGKVIVTGCMVETHKDELNAMNEVQASFTNMQKDNIVVLSGAIDSINVNSIHEISHTYALPFMRTRGYIKIQDGCDGRCSYCIVPTVRGLPQSRPVQEIIKHATYLIANQCPEIVLTGITIGKYNYEGCTLAQLVEKIINVSGTFRVRITSVEPTHVDDALIELLNHDKVCKHIHLPLQSGSDMVLQHMKRPYTMSFYYNLVEKIKTRIPDIAIGTDIIVGYPVEGDSDFVLTLQAVKQSQFAYIHQFTYSPRNGTFSSTLKSIPYEIVQKRATQLKEIAALYSLSYKKRFIGATRMAVIEKGSEGIQGLTDNYLKVKLKNDNCTKQFFGKLIPVTIKDVDENMIHANIIT